MQEDKRQKRIRRHRRVRAKIKGSKECPRLSVFRSNRHIYAQLIDDQTGKTLSAKSDLSLKLEKSKASKMETAKKVGQAIAKEIIKQKTKKVCFDRGGYRYHGRVKALAEGARAEGLEF